MCCNVNVNWYLSGSSQVIALDSGLLQKIICIKHKVLIRPGSVDPDNLHR